MRNIFKLSVMALVAAFAAGCSQNEEVNLIPAENGAQLSVYATASDFESSDIKNTRIVNEGANTTFETGDEIGVFAIRSTDNKLVCQNLPLKYTDETGGWTGNENKIYYYKNTTYIAYSPYDKDLNISAAADADDLQAKIKEHFNGKLTANLTNQATAYTSLDLMLAAAEPTAVEGAGGRALSFSFTHQMALVEIAVPVKAYLDEAKAFTYVEPFTKAFTLGQDEAPLNMYPLSIQTTGTPGEADATAYSLYRLLVKPETEYILSGELEYAGKPVTLDDKTVKLAAGTYMKYTIKADNAVSSYTKRAIAVGDYYYADGSICPGPTAEQIESTGEKDNAVVTLKDYVPFKEGCIGIIFSTTTTEADKEKGWTNGYVMALKNTSTSNTVWANTVDTDETVLDNVANDAGRFATLIADKDGYTQTMAMVNDVNGYTITSRPAFFEAVNYGTQCASPESSSGWFLPAIGQLVDIMNNLGGTQDLITASSNFTGNPVPAVFIPMLTLQARLAAVDGELGLVSNNLRWWGCNELSAKQSWCIDMGLVANEGKAKYVLLNRDKNQSAQNYHRARPVLAF